MFLSISRSSVGGLLAVGIARLFVFGSLASLGLGGASIAADGLRLLKAGPALNRRRGSTCSLALTWKYLLTSKHRASDKGRNNGDNLGSGENHRFLECLHGNNSKIHSTPATTGSFLWSSRMQRTSAAYRRMRRVWARGGRKRRRRETSCRRRKTIERCVCVPTFKQEIRAWAV